MASWRENILPTSFEKKKEIEPEFTVSAPNKKKSVSAGPNDIRFKNATALQTFGLLRDLVVAFSTLLTNRKRDFERLEVKELERKKKKHFAPDVEKKKKNQKSNLQLITFFSFCKSKGEPVCLEKGW